jgi:SAM-dependent methyltransferase
MPTYAVRAPLARWLEREAVQAHERYGRYRLLDVGCGDKPYLPFFEPFAASYIGVDPVENPMAELRGSVEALPVEDASYDVVLCAQVLEHCDDPAQAVRELARVTAPGGRVLASTHGVQVYHPSPVDYWRWTHAGLERLFRENAEWASVTVVPASGTTACLGMLMSIYLDLATRRAHVGGLGRPLIAAINRVAEALDNRSTRLREPGPGTLFANFHVVAEVPA